MSLEMRGLANFIQDIRAATNNREKEHRRIEQELGKIRAKFKNGSNLSAYDRKKYVCKLMFIFMLGYPIDFGHMEGVQLLSGTSQSEKLIGYLSVAVFLHENHELLTLTTHTIHLDLVSGKELNMCLALGAIANIGGPDFAEAMTSSVVKIISTTTSVLVLKKALLTLVRLFRKYPEAVQVDDVVPCAVKLLSNDDMGVCCCAMSLVQALLTHGDPSQFADVPRHCIQVMGRIILDKQTPPDYIYYGVPAPWLQMKAMRLLQHFPVPSEEKLRTKIQLILQKIVRATDKVLKDAQTMSNKPKGTYNRCNAMNSVLVEVVSLIIQYDFDAKLLGDSADILSNFVTDKKEPNTKYLGLALMSRMSYSSGTTFDFNEHMRQFQSQVIVSLHDVDISIRKKALELLYFMCNRSTADEIVGELLSYLTVVDGAFREDLVLMIAILAEKFCSDLSWYFEIILSLISSAGDYVSDDIWQRACHIVVNTPAIQKRAAETVFRAVNLPSCHELMVKVASFVLGEFGYQVALNNETSPMNQLTALSSKFNAVSDDTKCMILTTYVKFYNLYDNGAVRQKLMKLLQNCRSHMAVEVQQRAVEYTSLLKGVSDETLQAVLEPMPAFELEGNALLDRLKEKKKGTDKNVWAEKAHPNEEKSESILTEPVAREPTPPSQPLHVDPVAQVQPPQPAEQAVKRENTMDSILFGGGSEPAQTMPPSPPPVKEAPKNALDDIFGISEPKQSPSHTAESDAAEKYKRLRVAQSGTLYDDGKMSLSLSSDYRGADARITFTVANKTNSPIENFGNKLTSVSPSLMVQFKPAATVIPASQSIELLCAARSMAPFADAPVMQISYSHMGAQTTAHVSLPIVSSKFVEAYKVTDADKFHGLWGNTPSGDARCSEVNHVPLPKDVDVVGVEAFMFQRLRLFTIRTTATCVLGVGAHATFPREAPEYSPVLVRVELNTPRELHVSVKNPSSLLQQNLLDVIRDEIAYC